MLRSRGYVCAALVVLASGLVLSSGCVQTPEPTTDARDALGTVVSVTAYPASVELSDESSQAVDAAYGQMAVVEQTLDAWRDDQWVEARTSLPYPGAPPKVGSVSEFNYGPFEWHLLPTDAGRILERTRALEVEAEFTPGLFEVVALYDFESSGTVPAPDLLSDRLAASQTFEWQNAPGGVRARFAGQSASSGPSTKPSKMVPFPQRVGLDLGGAAKGRAIDAAIGELEGAESVEAALITAGSTTATFGSKPDGEPWRVGIEHPREPGAVIATVEADGPITISTSGDYQRFFERDTVRYHHILDPATGEPARGLQSLTVIGAATGTDSDILSTALFVMGADLATDYAEANGLGLVLVDETGTLTVVPGPEDAPWSIAEES